MLRYMCTLISPGEVPSAFNWSIMQDPPFNLRYIKYIVIVWILPPHLDLSLREIMYVYCAQWIGNVYCCLNSKICCKNTSLTYMMGSVPELYFFLVCQSRQFEAHKSLRVENIAKKNVFVVVLNGNISFDWFLSI